jgi:hypothetical protein
MLSENLPMSSSTAQACLPVEAAASNLAALARAPRRAPFPLMAVFQTRALESLYADSDSW